MSEKYCEAWREAIAQNLISDETGQKHIEAAEKNNWQYDLDVHSDVKGTLIQDGRLVEKAYQLLVLFQSLNRKIIVTSSDPDGSQHKLGDLGATALPSVIKNSDEAYHDNLLSRYSEKGFERTLPPAELLLDDNEPIFRESFVSYINPRKPF